MAKSLTTATPFPKDLDPARLPAHVAVIMDGNGRWANSHGWERLRGHHRGAEAVRSVTTSAAAWGISRLTLYAFSSENWQRPHLEVQGLMHLLAKYLEQELPILMEHKIRLAVIGEPERLPAHVQEPLTKALDATKENSGMVLCLALSYGGRDELTRACRRAFHAVNAGAFPIDQLTPKVLARFLDDPAGGEVDLVIRTAGEERLSNFMPWQTTYAEYVSTPVLWPDMNAETFAGCLRIFQSRERRFGQVAPV